MMRSELEDPVLLIDGDIYLYRIACAVEKEVDFGGLTVLYSDKDEIVAGFSNAMTSLQQEFNASKIIVALSDKRNFRKKVLAEYKENRKDTRKPIAYGKARKVIEEKYDCVCKPELEADDVLGILATCTTKEVKLKHPRVIVSIDKDFKSVPCILYNPDTKELRKYSEEEADYNFFYQTLIGDTTDNYKGLPGTGPVKAKDILDSSKNMWYSIVNAFEEKDLTEDDALVQARCARILRASDYNFKTNTVKLWTPK